MQTGASTRIEGRDQSLSAAGLLWGLPLLFCSPWNQGHLEGTPVPKGSGDMWLWKVDSSTGALGSCSLVLEVQLRELGNLDFQHSFGLDLTGFLPDPFLSSPSHLMLIPELTPARMKSLFVPAALGNSHCLWVPGTTLC